MKQMTKNVLWLFIVALILIASIPSFYHYQSNPPKENPSLSQDIALSSEEPDSSSSSGNKIDVEAQISQKRAEELRLKKCQSAIKDRLKAPLSFDHDAGTSRYSIDPRSKFDIVTFRFYARNGFKRDIYSKAICSFDSNGNLADLGIVNL